MHVSKRYEIDLSGQISDVDYRLTDTAPESIGYHHHRGFEIMQITDGEGTVLLGDNLYPLKPGALLLINSSTAHCTNPSPHSTYTRNKLTFDPGIIFPLLQSTGSLHLLELFRAAGAGTFIETQGADFQFFDSCFQEIASEYRQRKDGFLLSIISLLCRMILQAHRISGKCINELELCSRGRIARLAVDYINGNIDSCIGIDDICRELNYSKYYLCRTFRKVTGVTIMKYINQQKIAKAKNLLLSGDYDISEIALKTGFNGSSQFSRSFRQLTGISPREFRKSAGGRS